MARQMKPFRNLLKPSTKFEWTDELDILFHQSKEVIIEEMKEGMRLFDPNRPTCLSTDWSVNGVGFFLMQKYCQCTSKTPACCHNGWKLCLVGSRFTHQAESRYAPKEGEALAVAYALQQTRYYVLGCKDLIVATDYKPLVQVLNDSSLTEIHNHRLLNLKKKTLAYRFTIVHVPEKKNPSPDAASRHPADRYTISYMTVPPQVTLASLYQDTADTDFADDVSTIAAVSASLDAANIIVTWDMVRDTTSSDATLLKLMQYLEKGFPEDCRELPIEIRPHHRHAASLCVVDGVILMGQRIVIPGALRTPILNALHAAHQGISAMQSRAADSVFWPKLTLRELGTNVHIVIAWLNQTQCNHHLILNSHTTLSR
ncbi:uncharacterized protein LOC106174104 [Lingula anatina]|uniref:Uncharacterized protein LOC106174104 n=1 Tax=Lingula anatina TaxID=7574 RepID=A0A1S3JKK7_LINAN|nr:uncharacterized protein LOC106174104 [Lingula anatina]|eukprot:XP_013410955.1 uncharacterized protein LOC106174104 [Lingula anatina]